MRRLAIVLVSGEFERLQSASTIASVASTLGNEVLLFATMEGLLAFKKDIVENRAWKAGELGKKMIENAPLFIDMLKDAKNFGNLKVYACSMVIDMFKLSLDDFVDVFDDIVGVSEFLNMVEDAEILFI